MWNWNGNWHWNWEEMSNTERALSILFGLFILSIAFQAVSSIVPFFMLFFLIWWLTSDNDDNNGEDEATDATPARTRRPYGDNVFPHALAAVREAGMNPETLAVLPVDIGLIAFYEDDAPILHHTRPIPDDSDYIQPFVQLRVPQAAVGRVRFEIIDHYGQQVFLHEDLYQLERGRNLVTPSARIPLHDEQNIEGVWELGIYADGRLLARHIFGWTPAQAPDFDRNIGEDGEMNSELRAILAQSRLEQMSIDELLAYQDDDDDTNADAQQKMSRKP